MNSCSDLRKIQVKRGHGRILDIHMFVAVFAIVTAPGSGDVLHLEDGSVLLGNVLEQGQDHYLLSSPVFGDLQIPRPSVLYWAKVGPECLYESFRILPAGKVVLTY